MQRIVFFLLLFSFGVLSFSASCMMLYKKKSQIAFSITDDVNQEENNEKEEDVRDAQVSVQGRFIFGLVGYTIVRSECFLFKITGDFKLIHTPPPRN
jgi:hypothetical protein